jgi:cytochrome oxidase Cu insertion factor (SCO1/SenC/PrrC family)
LSRAGGLVLALLLAAPAACARRSEPLPVLFHLPPFALTERSGRPLTSQDLRGGVWIADFVFTRCAGVCPRMTGRMAALRQQVPEAVRFVTFTVDPEHDTPAVLTRYAEPLNPGGRWLFATGAKADLHRLATEGFKLAAMEMPPGAAGDGPFLHSSKFALVDGQGRVRGYYDSDDEAGLVALRADARRLLDERP